MRILIVEDEKNLAMVLNETFAIEGYYSDIAYDGESGLDCALSGIYDLIILDVMLPKMDGFEVLRRLRASKQTTAVLMLTARSELEDKVAGLDYGADDYLTKPFHVEELLARIRAMNRRKEKVYTEENIHFSDLSLDRQRQEIYRENKKVRLSKKEYDIMEFMLLHPNQIISKEQLLLKIWGFDSEIEYNSIEVYISFLRKKLAALGSVVIIKTLRGLGYTLEDNHGG